ncbi:MAG TPA: hypothetical protein VF700_09795, partial [Segetibacter sp.]
MERFVKDWYQARIENAQEREANAKDLIRILKNEDHTAIRELAENPLLLTIVALVHRIDAVLPDERVVLYLKCTETLLNTWHSWKYRGAEVKNRGREERRNRRRMEAIANWMHRQSLGTGKDQRSIVPYDDLHGFLTNYLTEVEKPYDVDSDPEDIANEFLEFVKKRAGLLIEVGDERYSFVHQTFQEYLTSAFIITSNELKGVNGIWEDIRPYCKDSRWTEVIRLLVAGLQSNASQEVIIQSLLTENAGASSIKAQLLGGLLLDGVEPAEIRAQEILRTLVDAAVVADENQLRPLLALLRTWLSKGNGNREFLSEVISTLWDEEKDSKNILVLTLIVSALELSGDFTSKINSTVTAKDREYNLVNLFLVANPSPINFHLLKNEFLMLWGLQDQLLLASPTGNFVASALGTLTESLPSHISARRFFEEQLIVLSVLSGVGPFSHYNLNCFSIACSNQSYNEKLIIEDVPNKLVDLLSNKGRIATLATAVQNIRKQDSELSNRTPASAARERSAALQISSQILVELSDRNIHGGSAHRQERIHIDKYRTTWSEVLSEPRLYSSMLNSLCKI